MIAIFDLDRTITRQPTWTRFLVFANRGRPVFWIRMLRVLVQAALYKLGFADRDSVKVVSLRTLSHLSRNELEEIADHFTTREVATGLRPGAVRAVEWHRDRGDRLILATASVDLIADRIAAVLGFDDVVATRLDWSAGQQPPPPRLDGKNCYGAEKLERFSQIGISSAGFAYSDHVSDIEMLRMADHPVAVNPSRGLRKLARAGQVTLADFNSDDISFLTMKARSSR